ncbi:hypothetical protein OH77DRAFT_1428727 [Trametes cingulata]|nr:hypothetical protein OH77DRAFT_1428727 [Trametes cingulata]
MPGPCLVPAPGPEWRAHTCCILPLSPPLAPECSPAAQKHRPMRCITTRPAHTRSRPSISSMRPRSMPPKFPPIPSDPHRTWTIAACAAFPRSQLSKTHFILSDLLTHARDFAGPHGLRTSERYKHPAILRQTQHTASRTSIQLLNLADLPIEALERPLAE